jgi:hypothetical protein
MSTSGGEGECGEVESKEGFDKHGEGVQVAVEGEALSEGVRTMYLGRSPPSSARALRTTPPSRVWSDGEAVMSRVKLSVLRRRCNTTYLRSPPRVWSAVRLLLT